MTRQNPNAAYQLKYYAVKQGKNTNEEILTYFVEK